jgi:hypothetical protein
MPAIIHLSIGTHLHTFIARLSNDTSDPNTGVTAHVRRTTAVRYNPAFRPREGSAVTALGGTDANPFRHSSVRPMAGPTSKIRPRNSMASLQESAKTSAPTALRTRLRAREWWPFTP